MYNGIEMEKQNYNWWDDPKNQEEVKRISWWNHSRNMKTIEFPLSIIQEGENWTVASNDETKKLIGKLGNAASGKTQQEAIDSFWKIIRFHHEFLNEERLSYQRWVPFRKGPWGNTGGNWASIFGIHVYLRYGKNMKGGWYIPFTKLNISLSNDWLMYKRWKKEKKSKR